MTLDENNWALLDACYEGDDSDDEAEAEITEAFRAFDRDCDGFISRSELNAVLKALGLRLTDEELDECVAIADSNQDGKIDFEGIT